MSDQGDLFEGFRRRDEAIESVDRDPWRTIATNAIRDLAASGRPFTSEDVCAIAGRPPHPNAVGARMNVAAGEGLIRRVGFVHARRANQHAALISQWIGVRK